MNFWAAVAAIAINIGISLLTRPKPQEGPRLKDLTAITNSSYGQPIPWLFGTARIEANMIWAPNIREEKQDDGKGGKGAQVVNYKYFASWTSMFCATEDLNGVSLGEFKLLRLWFDTRLVYDVGVLTSIVDSTGTEVYIPDGAVPTGTTNLQTVPGLRFRIYDGNPDQLPDPIVEEQDGEDAPAHRGVFTIVFDDVPLEALGNRRPGVSAEISQNALLVGVRSHATTAPEGVPIDATYGATVPGTTAADFERRVVYGIAYGENGPTYDPNVDGWDSRFVVAFDMDTLQPIQAVRVADVRPVTADGPVVTPYTSTAYWMASQNVMAIPGGDVIVIDGIPGDPITTQTLTVLDGDTLQGKYVVGSYGSGDTLADIPLIGYWAVTPMPSVVSGMKYYLGTTDMATRWRVFDPELLNTFPPGGVVAGSHIQPDLFRWTAETRHIFITPGKSSLTYAEMWLVCFNDGSGDPEYGDIDIFKISIPFDTLSGMTGAAWAIYHSTIPGTGILPNEATVGARMAVRGADYDRGDNSLIFYAGNNYGDGIFKWSLDDKEVVWTYQVVGGTTYMVPPGGSGKARITGSYFVDAGGNVYSTSTGELVATGSGVVGVAQTVGTYDTATNTAVYIGSFTGFDDNGASAQAYAQRSYFMRYSSTDTLTLATIVGRLLTNQDPDFPYSCDTRMQETIVKGYVVNRQGTVRDVIAPLAEAYRFDCAEVDFQLQFISRDGQPQYTIPYDDLLLPDNKEQGAIVTDRDDPLSLPRRVSVRFMDYAMDYGTNANMFQRPKAPVQATRGSGEYLIELPIVMTATEAATIAKKMLYDTWMRRNKPTFGLPPKYLRMSPTDVVQLEYRDGTLMPMQSIDVDIGADFTINVKGEQVGGTDLSVVVLPPTEDPDATPTLPEETPEPTWITPLETDMVWSTDTVDTSSAALPYTYFFTPDDTSTITLTTQNGITNMVPADGTGPTFSATAVSNQTGSRVFTPSANTHTRDRIQFSGTSPSLETLDAATLAALADVRGAKTFFAVIYPGTPNTSGPVLGLHNTSGSSPSIGPGFGPSANAGAPKYFSVSSSGVDTSVTAAFPDGTNPMQSGSPYAITWRVNGDGTVDMFLNEDQLTTSGGPLPATVETTTSREVRLGGTSPTTNQLVALLYFPGALSDLSIADLVADYLANVPPQPAWINISDQAYGPMNAGDAFSSVTLIGGLQKATSFALTSDGDGEFSYDGTYLCVVNAIDDVTVLEKSITIVATLADASTVTRTVNIRIN